MTDRGLWALRDEPRGQPVRTLASAEVPGGVAVATALDRPSHQPGTDSDTLPWWDDYPYANGVWGPVRPLVLLKKRRNSADCESCHNAPAYWVVFALDNPEAPKRWTAVYQVCHACRPPEDETEAWKPWADSKGGDHPRLTPVP